MSKTRIINTLALGLILGLAGCATDEYGNRRPLTDAEKGAIIGAVSGAVVGAATTNKKSKGALIGAVGGGIAGGLVGNYMDKQRQALENTLVPERNADAIHIEKLPSNILRVTMTSQTAFDVDSARIKGGFYSTLDKIATVVIRYGKTELTIVGHTDSAGSETYNQSLSERRARAVQQYFSQKGVIPQRLESYGKGESQPVATNATESGKRANRRVEIFITPVVAG